LRGYFSAPFLLLSRSLSLSLSAGKIIIRLLHDDYPTVRGCNTRNKRAVSWCGGSDDKLNKSAAHLSPLGETHVRTSVFRNEPVFNKSSPTTHVYAPCQRCILKDEGIDKTCKTFVLNVTSNVKTKDCNGQLDSGEI